MNGLRQAMVLAGVGVLALTSSGEVAPGSRPPNVLFVVADDLNATLGAYGGDIYSPHFDALAAQGMVFERAYCQVAVCGPSRVSVLSGLRPDMGTERIGWGSGGGTRLRRLRPGTVTLPELYQKNGYHTISLGKIFHHGEVETGGPVGPRMERDALSWSERAWYHGTPYQQWYEPRSFQLVEELRALPDDVRPRIVRGPPYEWSDQPDEAYADGQIASQAILTLRRLRDRPFFMAIGFRRPHLPFNCPQRYWDLYPESLVGLPDNFHPPQDVPAIALHDAYELRSYADVPLDGPIPERHFQNLVRGYKASVSYMDAQFGRVMAELKRLGLDENTIVVFWSDHGYHTGENGLWTKMTNFEIATRVPLIVSVPGGLGAGQRTKALVELIDLYPSLAELCGLSAPADLEGASFVPLLHTPDARFKDAAFSQYRRGRDSRERIEGRPLGRSMATESFRYTEWTSEAGELIGTELYDLDQDPGNNVNLAGRTEQAAMVAELSARLHASPLYRP